MILLSMNDITKAIWRETFLQNKELFTHYNIPEDLSEEFIALADSESTNNKEKYTPEFWNTLQKIIESVTQNEKIRSSSNCIVLNISGNSATGIYRQFIFNFKNIEIADECKCLFTISIGGRRVFSNKISFANEGSFKKHLSNLSKILKLEESDIKQRFLAISSEFENILVNDTSRKDIKNREKITFPSEAREKTITEANKNASLLNSNENKKNPPDIYKIDNIYTDTGGVSVRKAGILDVYRGDISENNNSEDTTCTNSKKVTENNLNCIEEIYEDDVLMTNEQYEQLKAQVLSKHSNLIFELPYNVSWNSVNSAMYQLFRDTDKLVFLIANNKTLKGRIESVFADAPKNICLLATKYDADAGEYNDILTFAESRDKAKIGETYYSSFFTHVFVTEWGAHHYLLSKKKLDPQFCTIKGMLVNTTDLSIIGETRKFSVGLPLFFLQTLEPDIIAYTPEQYLEVVKKYDHDLLMETISGKFRHPTWFEKMNCAFLFCFEHEMYGLNILMMARQGTGKSTYLDAMKRSMMEDSVFSGTASTLKGLVPNFGTSPPNVGYIARCRRVALVDEFLRILGDDRRHDDERVNSALGALNDILEHKTRAFCSGKGNLNVKSQARVFIATNPVHGTNTIVDLNKSQDAPMLSRFILYSQSQAHMEYIQKNKEKVGRLGEAAFPKQSFELISMVDYLSSVFVEMPEGAVSTIFKLFREQVPEPLLDTYDARYEHHITCILDGLAKYHAVMRHDNEFKVNEVVIADAIEILGEVISSWVIKSDDIKLIPVNLRKYYISLEHRLIFDLIDDSRKVTEEKLKEYLSEKQQVNLEANLMQLRHLDLIKRIEIEGVHYLVPYWFNVKLLSGSVTIEENKNIYSLLAAWFKGEEKSKMEAETKFGKEFIAKQLIDGALYEPKSGILKML